MAAKKHKAKNNTAKKKDDINKKLNASNNTNKKNSNNGSNNKNVNKNNNSNVKNKSNNKNNNQKNKNVTTKTNNNQNSLKVNEIKQNPKNKAKKNNNNNKKKDSISNLQDLKKEVNTNTKNPKVPKKPKKEETKREEAKEIKKEVLEEIKEEKKEETLENKNRSYSINPKIKKNKKNNIHTTAPKALNNQKQIKTTFKIILGAIGVILLTIIKYIGIILLYICKGLLISVKFVKNFIIKQYNSIRRRKKRKKVVNTIRREEIENDELKLLKYRDYPFYGFLYIFLVNRIRVIRFDMKNFKKKFKYGTFRDKLLIIFMMLLILGFGALLAFCLYIIFTAPEVSEEKLYRNTTTVLLDSDGLEFARIGLENRENVTYEDLPEVLVDAIVATEDSRFFQHNGLDIARFTKATIGQLMGRSDAGGGSTLTMQVSKKTATSTESHGIKGIIRKFTDIYLSVFVYEQRYTKEQILEFYVNLNFLGARSYGVEQASQTYFGKSVSELTLAEAAVIAGLFQAPDYLNPYNNPEGCEERRNTVLNLMERHGYITEEERDTAQSIPMSTMLAGTTTTSDVEEHQGFIDTLVLDVLNTTGYNPYDTSMTIQTTYNQKKQKVINDIYNTYNFQDDVVQIGIAVVDVDTGALIAVGAGRNKTGARQTNFARIERHPGSTAKPILDYGPAFEYLGWSPGNTVIDEEYTYTGGGNIKNFDNKFSGIMTVKKALAQSRNIPALFTFQQTTNDQKLNFAKDLGWNPETTPNGTLLESNSIGGFEPGVSPIQAAAAYATFARGGVYIEPYTYTRIEFSDSDDVIELTPKKKQVMSEETAYMINSILVYAVKNGPVVAGSVKGTEIAGKTGTSTLDTNDIKRLGISTKLNIVGDSWEVTYTSDYAIALWQGYEYRLTKEHYLLNSQAVKTRNAVSKLLDNGIFEQNAKFKKPSGITSAVIELETDPLQLASPYTPDDLKSTEYFKKGTEPTTVSPRFDQLVDPSNLRYSSTSYSVTLAWDAAPTPEVSDPVYLQEYFNNSKVYKTWAEKYYNRRINYNNTNLGTFGYRVYLVNESGTYDLGFTTTTQFTANIQFDAMTRFVVKSSYQKYSANQSPGVVITVEPNSESSYVPSATTTSKTTTEAMKLSIIYKGNPSCSTLSDYNSLGNAIKDKITVEANGVDVTNQANISLNCFLADDDTDQGGHCSNMRNDTNYLIEIQVQYKGTRRTAVINIKPRC